MTWTRLGGHSGMRHAPRSVSVKNQRPQIWSGSREAFRRVLLGVLGSLHPSKVPDVWQRQHRFERWIGVDLKELVCAQPIGCDAQSQRMLLFKVSAEPRQSGGKGQTPLVSIKPAGARVGRPAVSNLK